MIGKTTKENGKIRLAIHGAVLIEDATEFHRQVAEALEMSSNLEIDLKETSDVDLSAVQILFSAGKSAQKSRIDFNITNPSLALKDLLSFLGLDSVIFSKDPEPGVSS